MVFSLKKMHRFEVRVLAIRATKSAILLHVHSPYTVRAFAWYCPTSVRLSNVDVMAWWSRLRRQDWEDGIVVASLKISPPVNHNN